MAERHFVAWGAAGVAAAALTGLFATPANLLGQAQKADRASVVHVLQRVTFGPRETDVARVSRMGIEAYLEEQLSPERLDDRAVEAALSGFETLTLSSSELSDRYFEPARQAQRQRQLQAGRTPATGAPEQGAMSPETMTMPEAAAPVPDRERPSPAEQQALLQQRIVVNELMQARLLRAALSERQLQEVLVDFWFNHFNVFVGKGQVRQYLTAYERDVIRPHVLGNFRTLLGKVAHSPAMLFYLDNWQSSAPVTATNPNLPPEVERRLQDPRLTPEQRQRMMARLQQMRPQAGRQSRGLNENYARELMELHTLGVDGGYTQTDVVELARILTGWTIDRPQQGGAFVFRPGIHDNGTKVLLGVRFQPTGESEGEQALDLLARHPATARHIAFKLAQRFVADEPPAALVERVAAVFTRTNGNLRDVTRALLTSPEFLGTTYRRAKVKTPLEFVVSTVRATDATLVTAQPLVSALQNLGMPLYGSQPPTGYDMTSSTWVNTGALLARMNFAVEVVSTGRVQPQGQNGRGLAPAAGQDTARARRLDPQGRGALLRAPVRIDVNRLAPDTSAGSQQAVVHRLLDGTASPSTLATLARASTPAQLVALTLGSPEFQRR